MLTQLNVSLGVSLGAMFTIAPVPLRAQETRTAIEAQYERLAHAIRRNDVEGILALQAPEFTSINPAGTKFDFAAMERYTRRLATGVDSVIHIQNRIRAFEQHGDTAFADVCQEFSRIQRIGDGRPHRVDTSVLQREAWIRAAGIWKRFRVENVRGMRWFVDGVRVNPFKPYTYGMAAYQPEVDPPTGCGLR